MIDPGLLLAQFGEQQVAAFFLVLARVGPLFLLAPLFSSRSIPGRVRGIAAVAIAFGLSPIVRAGGEIPLDALGFAGLLLKEVLVGLVIGLVISIFQAVTQIQEQTLSFIPKIVGLAVVIIVAGPWMLGQMLTYTEELWSSIPSMVGGG